jgi:hypothetical protein
MVHVGAGTGYCKVIMASSLLHGQDKYGSGVPAWAGQSCKAMALRRHFESCRSHVRQCRCHAPAKQLARYITEGDSRP